ncbi:MAG: radical SAM protein [Cyclobacteriaceae bacterium]|nr:radical SAM protein [Cyclobacteriaceae bacterium]
MKKLNIGVIDLIHRGPTKALYFRLMNANLASIMPTVIAFWCEKAGHNVHFITYTGFEKLEKEFPEKLDLLFISAFTQAAPLAYSISALFRSKGTVTVLGGPHARCFPDDAVNYFDYVLGFTDKNMVDDILQNFSSNPEAGKHLSAKGQPTSLPSVKERWKYIEPTLKKAPVLKIIPMIGSMGCPYTCSFCIDSTIPYQMLNLDTLIDDIRFLRTKFKKPMIGWHDPNFGIRFNDYMEALESAAPHGTIQFIAETSLSILTEDNLSRLRDNGCVAMLPGIESWYELGNKTRASRKTGEEKVQQVSEHVRMVMKYIPYMQANFVMGLDSDEGSDPFELTKKFIDNVPAALPGYSLLTAFGEAAPINLEYQKENRVRPFPFHFLNNHMAMNVKPKNYEWIDFYDHVIDLTSYTFSWNAILKRVSNGTHFTERWMNFVRAISSEGFGRIRYFKQIRQNLQDDHKFRDFFEGDTNEVPQFYKDIVRRDLGDLYAWFPEKSWTYDPQAYLKKTSVIKASALSA